MDFRKKKDWKQENELNDREIEKIITKPIDEARELVALKKQEADIGISYLRTRADRWEFQVESLETQLKNKEDTEWLENFKRNSEKRIKIRENMARNAQRQRMGRGRQHLLNVRKKN